MMLSDFGRRVLGHLPVWAEDEEAHVKAEGGPDVSVRSYTLQQFTERLAEDPTYDPPVEEHACEGALQALADAKLAAVDKDGNWRMTKAGFDALHAPREDVSQTPGAVLVELHPAHHDSHAAQIGG